MKFEALMLRGLCAIGMLVCALVLGAMLIATPTSASNRMTANTVHAPLAACSPASMAEASTPARS